jgi:hypothetical protein
VFEILLPAAQAGELLHETLHRVSSSTCRPSRVVLVLDGVVVSERERNWLQALPYEVFIIEQARKGVTAALKAGEAVLSSQFFARLDLGDRVAPNRFERQIEHLQSHEDIVGVGVRSRLVFTSAGSTRERLSAVATDDEIIRQLPLRNLFVHGSLMFRTEAVRRVGGYNTEFVTSQDYDLLLRLSRVGRLSIIPDVLHSHYFHTEGSTLARPRSQLVMSLKAKWRHLMRGYMPSIAFCLYIVRDALLLLLPSRFAARLKSRSRVRFRAEQR